MFRSEKLSPDAQGVSGQRFRFAESSLIAIDGAEIIERSGGGGILLAEEPLADGERLRDHDFCFGYPALGHEIDPQIVEGRSHLVAGWTEKPAANRQRRA